MSNELQIIADTVYRAQPFFEAIDKTANFTKEAGFAIQVLSKNDYILGVARGQPQSVIDSVTNIAAVGLSLNPAQKQAYLIPRDGKICLDISYIGLLDLAIMSGSIEWGQAELVHINDRFTLVGVDEKPIHERNPFATDRGDLVGAYVTVKTRGGDFLTTTMPITEILYVRDRSEAWKRGKEGRRGPWESDFGEMAKKTVIKRAYKLWPKTQKLDAAIHHLNTDAGEGLPEIESLPTGSEPETRRQATLARLDRPINRGGVGAERAKALRAAAGEAIQKWNEDDEMAAYGAIEWVDDPDEREIVWAILAPHSALRSAIKRLDAAARERQAEIDRTATKDEDLAGALQASIDRGATPKAA